MKTVLNHKAVAPIIATLLMVAIAVVGGILIFVFTQGFFADEQVTGFKTDSLFLNGYNLKDSTAEDLDSGTSSLVCPTAALDGVLGGGDCIILFVQNRGANPLAIGEVRVMGETYTPTTNTTASTQSASGVTCDDGKDASSNAVNEFRVYNESNEAALIINPNTESVICLTYNNAKLGDVKPGKIIPIQIETENGQILMINAKNGVRKTSATGELTVLGGTNAPTNPGPTGNLALVATAGSNQVTFTWNAVDDQGLPTTYTLTGDNGYGEVISGVNTFAGTASNTICTTGYTWSLTTSNSAGAGPSTNAVQADLGVVANHDGSLNLAGTEPTNGDGTTTATWTTGVGTTGTGGAAINCDITTTIALVITAPVSSTTTITTSDGGGTGTASPAGLLGDGYSYNIRYTTSVDDGGFSDVVTNSAGYTYDRDCTLATANTPSVTDNNDGTVSVTWTDHTLPLGCTPQSFSLTVNAVSASTSDTTKVTNFGSFDNGLLVTAVLDIETEDNDPANTQNAVTINLDCGSPGVTDTTLTENTSPNFSVSWTHVPKGGCTTDYDISVTGGGSIAANQGGSPVAFNCQTAGVGNGVAFTVTVTADSEDTDATGVSNSETCNH